MEVPRQIAYFDLNGRRISVELVFVTPDLANRWLEKSNTHNRKRSEPRMRLYAGLMKDGQWAFTGETLKFEENNVLLDGQHRLAAVVKSGVGAWFIVIRGLSRDVFRWLDTPMVRNTKHMFDVEGRTHTALLSAACNVMYELLGMGLIRQRGMTHRDASDILEQHPKLPDFCSRAQKNDGLLIPSVRCVMEYITTRANADAAEMFWSALDSGAGLENGDAPLTLRNRLAVNAQRRAGRTRNEQMALVAHAWNAFCEGRKILKIQVVNKAGKISVPRITGYDPRPTDGTDSEQ